MRASRLYAPTLKENPNDAEVVSHQLLTRAGYIRKLTAGVYDFLPLSRRVLRKIETIIREELDRAGAQELLMPLVQPAEIWQESGRWQQYGPELLRFKDRKGAEFCLGPTHEEVIVDIVRRDVRSWRDLPLNLYQIQVKFRDEVRPRAGLMRGREFIMKDAYSFDVDEAAALTTYDAMYDAYKAIFTRCGLDFRPVEADTGSIGGSRSHEFQVLAESGEDAIVSCDACDYAANVEQAELRAPALAPAAPSAPAPTVVATPQLKSIDEVSAHLGLPARALIKSLVVEADGALVMALVRGDHELNEIKLKKLLGATSVEMASEERILKSFGVPAGFLGPHALPAGAVSRVVADAALRGAVDMATGANTRDAHFTGVSLERDAQVSAYADLRLAGAGDDCPRCSGKLRAFRGIEVGHVFYLGTKYSAAMKCHIIDEQSVERPIVMGCYGIGVSRVMAAAIEQNHDAEGICWPMAIAPFQVHILTLQPNVPEVVACAEALYAACQRAGIEALYDDRELRAGAKFKDADLMGIPLRVAIGGRGVKDGVVEVKGRREAAATLVQISGAVEHLKAQIAGQLTGQLTPAERAQ
ncbi:MAG: proline--tRNA ligase [Deltaproteobacteria bacterium]|nr:proline--tRNA ligase [Deltaproteobacteria bacterium]